MNDDGCNKREANHAHSTGLPVDPSYSPPGSHLDRPFDSGIARSNPITVGDIQYGEGAPGWWT